MGVAEHRFFMEATWQGGRLGTGELQGKGVRAAISIPAELGGPGAGTNPEELLIGAAMNCYLITLAAILEKRRFEVLALSCRSEGIVTVEGGSQSFAKIIHRPTVVLASADEEALEKVNHAVHRAEQACMISKALRGNVEIAVEPVIQTGHSTS
jgi:peroxiredoxin-like protein